MRHRPRKLRGASQLEAVRQEKKVPVIEVTVSTPAGDGMASPNGSPAATEGMRMQTRKAQGGAIQFFELEREYPNDEAQGLVQPAGRPRRA